MKKLGTVQSRRALLGVAALVCLLLAGWVFLPQFHKAPDAAYTGPVEDVSTGLIGEYAALILIAQERGYFIENGLNVTLTEYASGPEALTALWAGKIDTAMASDFAGVRNSFNGEDLKILATLSKSEAFFMIANKDKGITDTASLKGKKIGITQKTVGEFYLGQFLTFNRLALSDVKIIDLPQASLIDAVATGQIDAAVLFEPNAYTAELRLGERAVRWSVQSGQNLYSSLYTTGRFTRERPAVIERYMRAVVEAERFVKAHDSEARAIVAKRLKYDDTYVTFIWPKFKFEVSLDQELLLNMDDEARWVIEHHLTSSQRAPNYLRLVYFGGVEAAKPEGITIIH
jgi:NitT/TauT family transport system substrate-binding protein